MMATSASTFSVVATNGLDFSIWGGPGASAGTGLVVLLINEANTWTSIRVTYLASARSDFWLGSFSVATYLAQILSPNGIVSLTHALPSWTPSSASYTLVAEISGVRTAAVSPIIAFTNVGFNAGSGIIALTLSLSGNPRVESVVITYIIFNNASPIQFSSFNANVGSSLPYQFLGMDRV
jgi:hypothetical protein